MGKHVGAEFWNLHKPTERNVEQFWSKVEKSDGCWRYRGAHSSDGYGRVSRWINGREHHISAHRYAWFLVNGLVPEDKCVLHRCDNPPCCNPDHLFLGSHIENMRDKMAKGRGNHRRGKKAA